jgi:tryptophanyl-tRNA synthetase
LLGSQDKTASVEILLMLQSEAGSEEINVYQRKNRLGVEIPAFKINMRDQTDPINNKITILRYDGEIEEQENKKEQAKELILEILENGGKKTNEILEITKKQVGSKNTRNALSELTHQKIISVTREGKQNYYSLPKVDLGLSLMEDTVDQKDFEF